MGVHARRAGVVSLGRLFGRSCRAAAPGARRRARPSLRAGLPIGCDHVRMGRPPSSDRVACPAEPAASVQPITHTVTMRASSALRGQADRPSGGRIARSPCQMRAIPGPPAGGWEAPLSTCIQPRTVIGFPLIADGSPCGFLVRPLQGVSRRTQLVKTLQRS